MDRRLAGSLLLPGGVLALLMTAAVAAAPLGLPPVPVPAANPETAEKIELGKKLFNDQRFSITGDVSCATCHDEAKAFTDSPLRVSEGHHKLNGTRNAPTVANAAYFTRLFWDGRSPDLEDQSQHPFVNPVEMGLADHDPILKIVATDPEYVAAFEKSFGKGAGAVTMTEVKQAIAAFERTLVFGDSPFDRYRFGGDQKAMSDSAVRGFKVFLEDGRCVSCHTIEQDQALFTDNRFHNVGVGVNRIQAEAPKLISTFLAAKAQGADVDVKVLTDPKSSELGRFAITETLDDIGGFKTSTLRNIALTAPFMHDGSLATLRDVVVHYNNGGVTKAGDPVNDFLSGGIRPLDLTDPQIDDLVAFLEALTSPQFARRPAANNATGESRDAPGTMVRAGGPAPLDAALHPHGGAQ
jgi:cytochrome c peroxidase